MTEKKKEAPEEGKEINITKEMIAPYIGNVWQDLQTRLMAYRNKLGDRYKVRNIYERVGKDFAKADSTEGCMRYANEYQLIQQKKSTLPAELRKVVCEIVNNAIAQLLADERAKQQRKTRKRVKKGEETQSAAQPKPTRRRKKADAKE